MSTKHTPGPWSYRKAQTHPTSKVYSYEVFTPAYDVASATPHVGIRKEADARLMAAAPDLLEALEEMLAVAPSRAPAAGVIVGIEDRHANAISKARAAIAKAKGELSCR